MLGVITKLPNAKKIRLHRRRAYQRRLLRLRRTSEQVLTDYNKYYLRSTYKTFSYYKTNRYNSIELTNVVRGDKAFYRYHISEQSIRDLVRQL